MQSTRVRTWTVRTAGGALLFGALGLAACGNRGEAPAAGEESGAEHDALMARAVRAEQQRSVAAAAGKAPVVDLREVVARTGADSALASRLAPHVAVLNAALVRLAELHRGYDSTAVAAEKHRIDAEAYRTHLEADTYEESIHRLLTDDQHRHFHAYLQERAAAIGLPLDDSHGSEGVGTMGELGTAGHPGIPEHGAPASGSPAGAPDSARRRTGGTPP